MNNSESSEYLLLNPIVPIAMDPSDLETQCYTNEAPNTRLWPPSTCEKKAWSSFRLVDFLRIIEVTFGQGTHYFAQCWNYAWMTEVCSYVFSLSTSGSLVIMLVVYYNQPIPDWPQLISINSIVSLFSLFTRTGVSLVLAEGMYSIAPPRLFL